MENEPELYTKTMAKVYAEQGYYDKAAAIYRHLLEKEPDRSDLKEALAEVEMILSDSMGRQSKDLSPLFIEWFDLMMRHNSIQKLKRLRNSKEKG